MEQGGFFDGVPLGAVKHARFINKLGAFFTLTKLIYNGVLYDFSSGGSGSGGGGTVVVDPQYLKWQFVAPDGLFDLDALESMTLAEMLNSVADTVTQSPIKEWEDFAAWLNTPEIIRGIQSISDQAAYGGIKGILIQPPAFSPPENFSAFLRWLSSISGEAGALSARNFRAENGFAYEISMFGKKGVNIYIKTPESRPNIPNESQIVPGVILYTDGGGMVSRSIMVISGTLCPTLEDRYNGYTEIVYAYEDTNFLDGSELIMHKGWYAFGVSEDNSIMMTEFDLEQAPIVLPLSLIENPSEVIWDAIYPIADPEIVGEPDAIMAFLFQI